MASKKTDHGRGTALAEGPGPPGFQIKGRLWLEKNGESSLSWGRVVLLERIRELGSIAAAARSKELAIWKQAGIDPKDQKWYREVGQGMEKTQRVTND
jgi:hypothetical protein